MFFTYFSLDITPLDFTFGYLLLNNGVGQEQVSKGHNVILLEKANVPSIIFPK